MKLTSIVSFLFLCIFLSSVVKAEDIDLGQITCMVEREENIEQSDDKHFYHFSAVAGQTAFISIARTGGPGGLWPRMCLYDSGEQTEPLICVTATDAWGADMRYTFTKDDTYTIMVKARREDSTGGYGLSLLLIGDSACFAALSCESEHVDSISPEGDIDGYTFQADTGDTAVVSIATTDDFGWSPVIKFYDSEGDSLLFTGEGNSWGLDYSYTFTPDDKSPYYVVVNQGSNGDTGNYQIILSGSVCIGEGACCLPDNSCVLATQAACDELDGDFMGVGTDCPCILKILSLCPYYVTPGEELCIWGEGFGDSEEGNVVHIGGKTPSITFWSDIKVCVTVPNYKKCERWDGKKFMGRKTFVTVGVRDSNKKRLRIFKPDTCQP